VIWPSQKYFMNRAAHEKFALGATTLPAAIRMIDEKHATRYYLLIDLILLHRSSLNFERDVHSTTRGT
jgi:hypothetical protein